ncbi:DUF2203 domain-containing protein [Paenibacillus montanisoli]|uniref:DUF2203 domain-containing protein n=1 Tax=Paenibacillus montanisoli TaxID=2081970 RepID=A0A328UBS7_9BACL|nr:DUF2203 domain-containing protein [Paenibacillus montanisoli]RAP78365.1 DUF2203 domain-containing protein [Paenibacillus montanisoli]
MQPNLFTLSEANAILPQLQEDLLKLQLLTQQFEEKFEELQMLKGKHQMSGGADVGHDPYFELESQLEFMRIEIDMQIGNFDRKGVLLKMINPGLIDFPSIFNGEEILICWKQGEERATHYHGWNDGFMGRKAFPEA